RAAPAEASWYYVDAAGGQQGPVSRDDLQRLLRTGAVRGDTLVCQPGMAQWVALESLDGSRAAEPAPETGRPTRENGLIDREERLGWRQVGTGMGLLISAAFVLLAALVLAGFGALVATAGNSPGGMMLT